MDFKQLHYITAIAESQNITRAAENLFISRSALNYSLLNLEQEIGLPLFKRINNTMIPTAAGKVFLEHAYQILQISKDCRKNLEDMVDCARGTLSLGITPGYGQALFSVVFPEFYKAYPKYDLDLVEGNVKDLYSYLLSGRIDFAWSGFHCEEAGLEHTIFHKSEVLLAVPEAKCRHRSSGHYIQTEPADLSLYRDERFVLMKSSSLIRDIANLYFEQAGFTPHILFECSKIDMTHAIAQEGIALTFVPRNLCLPDRGVVYFPVEPREHFGIAISFRKGTYLTTAEQHFIDLLHRHYRSVMMPGPLFD